MQTTTTNYDDTKKILRAGEIRELTRLSKVPKIFAKKSVKDFQISTRNKNAIQCINAIRENKSLYIFGECGTGKTLLASIIQNEKIKLLKPSIFLCITDIFAELNPYSGNFQTAMSKREQIKNISCLIIDDLGVEKPSEWTNQTLFDIINHRYNENLQTIITSNFTIERLQQRLSKSKNADDDMEYSANRIIRRIKAICQPVEISEL